MRNHYVTNTVYAHVHLLLLFLCCIPGTGKTERPTHLLSNKSTANTQIVRTWLFTQSGRMADGNAVVFGSQYSNAVDVWDAMKMTNPGENFGLSRQGYTLAVEARQPVSNDTMFFKMTNLGPTSYKLKIVHEGMETVTNATCELIDRYLNTHTAVSYNDTTYIDVPLNSDPASRAQNRLMLVYKPINYLVLPVSFVSFDVLKLKDKEAKITWSVANETGIKAYAIEASENGDYFYKIGSVSPSSGQSGAANYVFQHKIAAGPTHYYRIRAASNTGKDDLSKIILLQIKELPGIRIFPNPVVDKNVQVTYSSGVAGNLSLRITDASGNPVYQRKFIHTTAGTKLQLPLQQSTAPGIYNLTITAEDGSATQQRILVL